MYSIYKIEKDGKILYIGKTVNFKRRKWEHTYRRKLDKTYNFVVIIDNLTKEEAKLKEEELIKKYDTVNNGWNRTYGEGHKGVETKNGDGRFKPNNEIHKLRKKKKVLHIETKRVYNSTRECAEKLNIPIDGIHSVCNGKRKSYKNNHFKYV
jgi:predicted GIY-YIG superfamily endonuclease